MALRLLYIILHHCLFLKAYEYQGAKPADFPVAVAAQTQILSLPIYPELEEKQISYIADNIKSFYNSKRSTSHKAAEEALSNV